MKTKFTHSKISQEDFELLKDRINILIVIATEVEYKIIMEHLLPLPYESNILTYQGKTDINYYHIGVMGNYPVCVLLCDMGSTGRNASQLTVQEAVSKLDFKLIISLGIAFGVNEKKQNIGDILISENISFYDIGKIINGKYKRRDKEYISGVRIFNLAKNFALQWNSEISLFKASYGDILSGNKVIDDAQFRDDLVSCKDTFIGGEMEGAGIFSVCNNHKIDCILIKSICDFAAHKSENKELYQLVAATTAVLFCKSLLSMDNALESLDINDIDNIHSESEKCTNKLIEKFNLDIIEEFINENSYISELKTLKKKSFNQKALQFSKHHLSRHFRSKDFLLDKVIDSYIKIFNLITECSKEIENKNIFSYISDLLDNGDDELCAIDVQGEHGVGKSTLLSVFYLYQHSKWQRDSEEYFPIFIDLKKYKKRKADSDTVIQAYLEKIKKEISVSNVKKLVVIIDDKAHYDDDQTFFNKIIDFLNSDKLTNKWGTKLDIKKIIGHSISYYKCKSRIQNSNNNVITLTSIDLKEHYKSEMFINEFIKVCNTPVKYKISAEVILQIMGELDIDKIDFITLHLILSTYHQTAGSYIEMIDKFCINHLQSENPRLEKDFDLNKTAELAYNYYIKEKRNYHVIEENYLSWNLVHFHSTITAFLIAKHIINQIQNSEFDVLEYIYPNSINRFCKEMIEKDNGIYKILNKKSDELLNDKKELLKIGSSLIYLLGRFSAKNKEKLLKKINQIICHIETYKVLGIKEIFLLRSSYVSLIYNNNLEAFEAYVEHLLSKPSWGKVNINFHKIYYEDIEIEMDNFYDYLDDDEILNYPAYITFDKLYKVIISKIDNFSKRDVMFQFNLLTLFSIYHNSKDVRWKSNVEKNVKNVVKLILPKKNKLTLAMQDYLKVFVEYIGDSYSEFNMLEKMYNLKFLDRQGWKNRKVKSPIESVSSHMHFCSILATFLLNDSEQYSKAKVLEMLLVHDIIEAYTGDIPTYIKNKKDSEKEIEIMRYISVHGIFFRKYASIRNIKDIFIDFVENKTYEAKLANDFDQLECYMQLCYYKYRKNEVIDDFEEWKLEIAGKLRTTIGQDIMEDINLHFQIGEYERSDTYIFLVDRDDSYKYYKDKIIGNLNKPFYISKAKYNERNKESTKKIAIVLRENKEYHLKFIITGYITGKKPGGHYLFKQKKISQYPNNKINHIDENEIKNKLFSLNKLLK